MAYHFRFFEAVCRVPAAAGLERRQVPEERGEDLAEALSQGVADVIAGVIRPSASPGAGSTQE